MPVFQINTMTTVQASLPKMILKLSRYRNQPEILQLETKQDTVNEAS